MSWFVKRNLERQDNPYRRLVFFTNVFGLLLLTTSINDRDWSRPRPSIDGHGLDRVDGRGCDRLDSRGLDSLDGRGCHDGREMGGSNVGYSRRVGEGGQSNVGY